jgi:Trypsin-co-occurring domain 2
MTRSDKTFIDVADAIRSLRAQLAIAHAEVDRDGVYFEMGPVEIEFVVEVERAVDGDAGVRIGVVSIGASGSVSSGTTHRMKFVLSPMDGVTGRALEVADRLDEIPER